MKKPTTPTDEIQAAIDDVLTAMESTTGARFWAQQLRDALRTRPDALRPPLTWGGASIAEAGFVEQTLGPCVLRAGHDGPVHKAANGAKWWPNPDSIVRIPEPMTEEQVDAIRTAWNERYGRTLADPSQTIARLSEELAFEKEQREDLRNRLKATSDSWGEVTDQLDAVRAELAALREGEEEPDDESAEPTPAQWLWKWNRVTPQSRLDMAHRVQELQGHAWRLRDLTWSWDEAPPLLPGQALADLRNALSDDPQPTLCHVVHAGKRTIFATGNRVPTPDECSAIGALLDANEVALAGGQEPATVPAERANLNARLITHWVPACPTGRHAGFPSPFGVIEIVVPPALRGPNCPRPPNDPEPLRKLAEQALATPKVRRAYIPGARLGDFLPGYRTAEDFDNAPPPVFTGLLSSAPTAAPISPKPARPTAEEPCSTQDCPGNAVVAIAFKGQYGHVHHCAQCAAEAREWYDVATSAPLPCPYSHGDGTTWIEVPPDLNWPPTDTTTED